MGGRSAWQRAGTYTGAGSGAWGPWWTLEMRDHPRLIKVDLALQHATIRMLCQNGASVKVAVKLFRDGAALGQVGLVMSRVGAASPSAESGGASGSSAKSHTPCQPTARGSRGDCSKCGRHNLRSRNAIRTPDR